MIMVVNGNENEEGCLVFMKKISISWVYLYVLLLQKPSKIGYEESGGARILFQGTPNNIQNINE